MLRQVGLWRNRAFQGDGLATAPGEERAQIKACAFGQKRADGGQKPLQPALVIVGGNRAMRFALEDLPHHAGVAALGPEAEEHPRAVVVHPLHLRDELHRRGELLGQCFRHLALFARIGRSGEVGIDREGHGPKVHVAQEGAQLFARGRNDGRMEGGTHGDRLHLDALGLAGFRRGLDPLAAP